MVLSRAKIAIGLLACLLASSGFSAPLVPAQLSGSLIGFVGDQTGVPQMGAAVLLYNQSDRLIARTLSNEKGAFGFESLLPGVYSIRVSLSSFVTAAKERIQVQPGVRNFLSINLASMLSSVELVYSAPGQNAIMSDDWEWVLRTATASRPVLRIRPAIDISDPAKEKTQGTELKTGTAVFSDTRGLLKVGGGEEGTLAAMGPQSDLGTSFALATSVFGENQLQFSGNLGYASSLGSPTAGFRTSYKNEFLGMSPEIALTMRQAQLRPHVGAAVLSGSEDGAPRLRTMSFSSIDRRQLTGSLEAEFGASLESVTFLERLNYLSPFARLTYDLGNAGSFQVSFNSGMPPAELLASSDEPTRNLQSDLTVLALFPRVSLIDRDVRVQRIQNFEIAYRKVIGSRSISVGAYRESVTNGAVMMTTEGGLYGSGNLLPDLSSNASVFNIGNYDRMGYRATFTQKFGELLDLSVSGGNGGVLEPQRNLLDTGDPSVFRSSLKSARRNWLATRAAAKTPWSGTHITATYQWTDYDVVNPTHLYLTYGMQPELGLNILIRQPLPTFGIWSGRFEATAELRNLLSEGDIPVSTSEGQKLFLIQNPRAVRGGVSFIF